MKKVVFFILIAALTALPCLFAQDADREVARTQEFIGATTQKGQAKVDALNAYIKKFPETSSRWTRLAHYHLAVAYFELKDYAKTVEYANKTLKLGSLEPGEEGRMYLVIANSYGVKSASIFNQEKALEFTQKALDFAEQNKLTDVLSEAQKLKKSLSGPPPKSMTPEQQIKYNFSNGDYSAAIAFYQKLGAADKANPEIWKTYANALFKANQSDAALKEFKAMYDKQKTAWAAFYMGDIYSEKAKKNDILNDSAVNYYLEASVLFGKENNAANQKTAYQKAEYQLFEKYGFNKKVKELDAQVKKSQGLAAQNADKLRAKKLELLKLERRIRKEWPDIDPPDYILKEKEKLESEIAALEQGVPQGAVADAAKLEQEKVKIQKELSDLLAKVKKNLQ